METKISEDVEAKTRNKKADQWIAGIATGLLIVMLTFAIAGSVSAQPGNSAEARGLLREEVRYFDFDLDGDYDFTIITENSFDNRGRFISEVVTSLDATNQVIRQSVGAASLAKNGEVVGVDREIDADGDGSFDYPTYETREYNAKGNLTMRITEVDADSDGTVDRTDIETRQYDKTGRLAVYRVEQDYDNDGTVDSVIQNEYEFNQRNILKRFNSTVDSNNDGVIDRYAELEYSLAKNGDFTGYTQLVDNNGDNLFDLSSKATFVLNNRGFLEQWEIQTDNGIDGTIDSEQLILRSY